MINCNEFSFGMKVEKEEGSQSPQFIFSHFMVDLPIEMSEEENSISDEDENINTMPPAMLKTLIVQKQQKKTNKLKKQSTK